MDFLPKKVEKLTLYEPISSRFYVPKAANKLSPNPSSPLIDRQPSVLHHRRSTTKLHMGDEKASPKLESEFSRFNEELKGTVTFRNRDGDGLKRLQSAR